MTTGRIAKLLPALFFMAAFTLASVAGEKTVFVLSKEKEEIKAFGFYNIRAFYYSAKNISQTVGTEVEDDLAKCKILMVRNGAGDAVTLLFGNKKYCGALKEFMARGGVIFFDYNADISGASGFLKQLGMKPLSDCEKPTCKYYLGKLTEAGAFLGEKPNKLKGSVFSGGFGGWMNVPEGMNVLVRMDIEPNAAALLEKNGVEGKGRIYFSRLATLMKKADEEKAVFENFWSYLFGEDIKGEGPGTTKGIVDTYKAAEPAFNPLYLSHAKETPWWNAEYKNRLPVLLAEPIGMKRKNAPVSLLLNRKVKGFALLTYYDEKIPAQKIDMGDKTEIIFQTDLLTYENKLFYLYLKETENNDRQSGCEFTVENKDGFIVLANDAIRAKIYEKFPAIETLEFRGGGHGNAVSNFTGIDFGRALDCLRKTTWDAPRIIEQGPVRVTIAQTAKNKAYEIRFSIFAGDSPFIGYKMITAADSGIANRSCWAPSARCGNSTIVYESAAGIKYINGLISPRGTSWVIESIDYRPFMKEGWYAIEDTSGEAVGTCFDYEKVSSLEIGRRAHQGFAADIRGKTADKVFKLMTVLSRNGWNGVRDNYIAFKNPPEVRKGTWQDYGPVTVAKTNPQKDFYMMLYYRMRWFRSEMMDEYGPLTPAQTARKIIDSALKWGANALRAEEGGGQTLENLAYWQELVRLATLNGICIFGYAPPKKGFTKEEQAAVRPGPEGNGNERPCPIAFRKEYYEKIYGDGAEASAKFGGGDLIHIMDEYAYSCTCDKCKEQFKKRFGGELKPYRYGAVGDLKDRNYANAMLFRMQVLDELAGNLAKKIHSHLPNATTSSVVNMKGINTLWRVTDLEMQSKYLDMPGVDLYDSYENYRRILMFVRGSFGNRKRVENCVGYSEGKRLTYQLDLSTMYGASMQFFGGSDSMKILPQRTTEIIGPYYCWLKYSGIAKCLSRMAPVKYAALLRDRSLLIESIKNGEGSHETMVTERGLYALADLNNIQMDMVFSLYFNAETLKDYKLLLVPDNKYLNEEFAGIIKDFAEKGGTVYVEGKACSANAVMKALCSGGKKTASLETFDFYLKNTGKGRIFYTEGFLSEKLPFNKKLKADFEKILLEHSAAQPLTVKSSNLDEIDNMLYRDGKEYLIAVLNKSPFLPHSVEVFLNDKEKEAAIWVDMKTGNSGNFTGPLTCVVEPMSVKFLLIAPEKQFSIPKPEKSSQNNLSCYADSSGMKFANVKLKDEDSSKLKIPKVKGKINVGVFVHPQMTAPDFTGPKGQLGIYNELKKADDMALTAIQDLNSETLECFDVVVVPNIRKAYPQEGWEGNIRQYVLDGGNALLIHHAVGFASSSKAMFPEIGAGIDVTSETVIKIVSDHPALSGAGLKNGVQDMKKDTVFSSQFPDYIRLTPGASGKVLAQCPKGKTGEIEDVIVAGEAGKGKVVLCGVNIGCKYENNKFLAEVAPQGERNILLNSIRWLAAAP
ncbi:MAG: hypothetical protein A2017_13445 [Lentisphaerae bacterium GWF2_44_16]|nr:MAG: hypothetical protein A2017_13445 [Lentisphaerae bacterium GWF2_44_16]